jgi:nicotinamidase-related amidase
VSRSRARASTALLLIDVVNPFDFDGADDLLRHALPAARRIAALRARAERSGAPVIYVNDNFGDWHSGLPELVERCRGSARARPFVEQLRPRPEAYYVLKPRHSGFLSTSLDPLLERLGVRRLVLAGVAAHICVLFTAIDGYMRGFEIAVASDCVASEDPDDCAHALGLMAQVLKARVARGDEISFGDDGARRRNGTRKLLRSSRGRYPQRKAQGWHASTGRKLRRRSSVRCTR